MVLVFYAYGGWNEAAFIASEVEGSEAERSPGTDARNAARDRDLYAREPRLSRRAWLWGVCKSKAIAADMFALAVRRDGPQGHRALVMFSSLGSIHGLLFTGMRLYGTFGKDHKLFAWLSGKEGLQSACTRSVVRPGRVQHPADCASSSLAYHWRQMLGEAGTLIVGCSWIWTFRHTRRHLQAGRLYGSGVLAVLPAHRVARCSCCAGRIRIASGRIACRSIRSLPLVFVLSCAFMLYRSTAYALEQEPAEALIVAGLMLLGIPLGMLSDRAKIRCHRIPA